MQYVFFCVHASVSCIIPVEHCDEYVYIKSNAYLYAQETSTSLNGGVAMNSVKERDKSYKRKSYLNRSRHTEAVPVDRLSESKEFTFDIQTATVLMSIGF